MRAAVKQIQSELNNLLQTQHTLRVRLLTTGMSTACLPTQPSPITISSKTRDVFFYTEENPRATQFDITPSILRVRETYVELENAGLMIRLCWRHSSPLAAKILGPHILPAKYNFQIVCTAKMVIISSQSYGTCIFCFVKSTFGRYDLLRHFEG
jgi:hypothetical protein